MPGYRYHAFADAPIYAYRPPRRRGWLSRLWRRLALRVFWTLENEQVDWVCAAFAQQAVVGPNLRVTTRAWCSNPAAREHVIIGADVICRGLIRIEQFHPGRLQIGDSVYLGDETIISCAERIEIGSFTMLAHGVEIFDNDSHPVDAAARQRDQLIATGRQSGDRPQIGRAPIHIGERCWIGAGARLLKGTTLGPSSIVAAGSVVTADVPANTLVAGNPARVVRALDQPAAGT